jgi:Phage portal protein, SPP1 Gp6-like
VVVVAPEKYHVAEMAKAEEDERVARYARAWAAYDGEAPQSLEIGDDGIDDNVRLDKAATIVNKGVSFLAGKGGVTFQLEAPDAAAEDDGEDDLDEEARKAAGEAAEELAQKLLAKVEARFDAAWPPEKRILDFQKLATNGAICGHFWFRLHDEGGGRLRVSILDPANCTAVWNEDDVDILERYVIEWVTVDQDKESLDYGLGVLRRKVFEPDDPRNPKTWKILDEERDENTGTWTLLDETPWPHAYAPVIDGQNLPEPNSYYGRSDLEPAILDLLEQLESVASDMRHMVRHLGHPIPVVIGEEASKLQTIDVAVGKLLAIPNKDAKFTQLEIAELTSSLELYRELKTEFMEATRIPKVALGETENAGPVAAVALEVEYEPLIEKTETKRLTYGPALVKAGNCVLDLLGFPGWTVSLGWPKLLPSDTAGEALADESEQRMGIVSKQTLAEKRGYDWSVESQRLEEEKPNFDAGEPELPGPGGLILPGGEGGEE